MELLYIWIEDFGIIRNQEFGFSNEFDIELQQNKLIIFKKDSTKLNLFNDSFLNITAIIGKNGSGKSTLLSFIKSIFSDSYINRTGRYILAIKDSKNDIIVIDKYSENESILEIENRSEGKGLNITKKMHTRELHEINNSINLITHSNSFSVYERDLHGTKYLDISFNKSLDLRSVKSNELLIERYNSLLKEYKVNERDEKFEQQKSYIQDYTLPRNFLYHYDLQAKVGLISKYKDEKWKFIPEYIEINFNQLFYFNNKQLFEKFGFGESLNKIEKHLFENRNLLFEKEDQLERFKDRINLSLFLFYTIHDQFYYPRSKELQSTIELISKTDSIEEILLKIKDFFKDISSVKKDNPLNKTKEFYDKLDEKFDSFKWFEQYSNTYTFYANDKVCETLNELFDIWLNNDFIFSFQWHALSAGESALLSLFARFHSIGKAYFLDNIWLLIDEGDLYLHPEWQRTFLSDLHKYLPLFYTNKKIQLILTSHSPFLVSDLPKENIILLSKNDENGLCKVVDKSMLGETFGANIHSLFKESFFMENGVMGQFAQEKIVNLIDYLKNNVLKSEKYTLDEESSLVLINMIGEPIIRKQLQDMWNEKFLKKEMLKSNTELARQVRQLTRKLKLERIENAAKKNK